MRLSVIFLLPALLGCQLLVNRFGAEPCGNFTSLCEDSDVLLRCDGEFLERVFCEAGCLSEFNACSACGNRTIDSQFLEQCDDGNFLSGDGCSSDCQIEECGNNNVDFGEICDDGNQNANDGCRADCLGFELCGDSLTDEAEACDDGNQNANDGCRADCLGLELCGDRFVDESEICDDGNTVSGDGCNEFCTKEEICGDGLIDTGEICDDGNVSPNDGCRADCLGRELCGDGRLDLQEECDDGNLFSGDGCDAACQAENCGDGIIQLGEDCDDQNLENNDGCGNNCRFTCTNLQAALGVTNAKVEAGHCYLFFSQPKTWEEARVTCNSILTDTNTPGHLVSITSARENATVRTLNNNKLWLGLSDQGTEGQFRWDTGERLSQFINFGPSEPNDSGGQDCTAMFGNDVTWDDERCSSSFPFICEVDFEKQCGNGVIEQGETCDDGNNIDGDGCSADCRTFVCAQEQVPGAQVRNFSFSDACFILYTQQTRNAIDAATDCIERGGHLATIRSQTENVLFGNLAVASAWIAFADLEEESIFRWGTGEATTFTKFEPNQPDNNNGTEDCVEYTTAGDDWNDVDCSNVLPYICEF